MQVSVSYNKSEPKSGNVEILTNPGGDLPLGYKISGVRDGPTAMVSANSRMVDAIAERLSQLPTLPWLQGSIYLMSQEVMDRADARILKTTIEDIAIDEAILLPCDDAANQDADKAASQGYWTTLRLCARLGIIQGRGVPR